MKRSSILFTRFSFDLCTVAGPYGTNLPATFLHTGGAAIGSEGRPIRGGSDRPWPIPRRSEASVERLRVARDRRHRARPSPRLDHDRDDA